MAITAILHRWQAERDKEGRLMVMHPVKNKRVRFSPSMIKEFAGIKPQITEEGKVLSFDGNPLGFAAKYLPHLLAAGILRESDFRTLSQSRTSEKFNVHERRLKADVPNISFSNAERQNANYYIGRKKLVGTEIDIEPEQMKARLLDKNTVGIIKNEKGNKQIVATFNLLGSEQLTPILNSVRQRLIERGQQPTISKISQNTVVGEKIMRDRVRQYSITDYLKPRPGENAADYYKRLRPLDNPEFVTEKTQQFFKQAGIGIHNLAWSEQLVLSRAFLEKVDEQRLLKFSKSYGLTGVRTFLSLDYDSKLGNKILGLGEKLEPALAKAIFQKYSEIVDAANQAQGYVENLLYNRIVDSGEAAKVREQLLKRGKDLLAQMADATQTKSSQLESVQLFEQLESIKTEILLFAATYKNFAGQEKIDLQTFPGVDLQDKDSSHITEHERSEMHKIFLANRLGNYPDKLREHVLRDFEKNLAESDHLFRILKHDGQIVAFFHYDQIDPETFYVGSLNLHPSAKDSPIAVTMLKDALREKADKNIKAVVWADNPARLFYTKFLGFKKVSEIPDYHNTGEKYWELVRPAKTGQMELPEAA